MRSRASASAAAGLRARRAPRRRAGRDRNAPLGRLPPPADHRHRALPPRRGRAQIRGLAQQHLQPARACGLQRHRPRGQGVRPPAARAAAAAGDLRQLALPRRPRQRPALGAHAELHQELPALRDPRPLRRLGRLPQLHRVPDRDALDRRVHAGLVVGAPALQLRHGRGPDLRRAGNGAGVRGAGLADGRLHRAGHARRRRRRAVRAPGAAPGRGEPVAGDPVTASTGA